MRSRIPTDYQTVELVRQAKVPALQPLNSEIELRRDLVTKLRKNSDCEMHLSFLGSGVWQHHVPALRPGPFNKVVQEPQRIGQDRLGIALEQGGQRLQRELRGHLALGVAAHAVGQREETGIPRVAIAHAVFVLLAAALAADLVDGEAHGRPDQAFAPVFRFSSCSLSRSLKLSLV